MFSVVPVRLAGQTIKYLTSFTQLGVKREGSTEANDVETLRSLTVSMTTTRHTFKRLFGNLVIVMLIFPLNNNLSVGIIVQDPPSPVYNENNTKGTILKILLQLLRPCLR